MTKIDIISGFLGAGKTTFIKKMLEESFKDEQVVLIENEFGEVGIDGGFLKDAGIEITEMNSGCICCSLVGDFATNLHEVINKYHPDRILIEPSGVGKLSDVMKSVIDIEKEEDVKLNALVTVVNALKASKQMKAFGEFFNNQIEYATTVILSRSQNATPEQLEFCVKQIQNLNAKAAIITTDWNSISGKKILEVMEGQDNLEMKVMAEAKHEHHHDHDHHNEDECPVCGGHHDHDHEHEHDHEHHHDHEHDDHEHEHDDHEHEHHHDHEEHEHHHDHDHDHGEHEHHHDHDHDHEEHEHHHHHHHDHDHEDSCSCGHDHDADEVFISWGAETPRKYTEAEITGALNALADEAAYGVVLRAKGIVPCDDGTWIHFDYVPGEENVRRGPAGITGRLCVIGSELNEDALDVLFHLN